MRKKEKKRAIIIDDDALISNLYKASMEKDDFSVEVVLQGDRALDIIESQEPDVVLLDLVIGDKSGTDILKELKGNKKTSHIPVIITSSLVDKDRVEECTALGAAGYIAKGHILPSEAIKQIKALLKINK